MNEFVEKRLIFALRGIALACCVAIIVSSNDILAARLVVNPASPNASDTGNASEGQPLATIAAAMKRLQPGDSVFVAAGLYREPILLPNRPWAGAAETVIEGDKQGRTLIKGSVLMPAWRQTGSGRFIATIGYEPEQIFVNGEPLQQIGGTVFGGYPGLPNHPLAPLFPGVAGGIWPGRVAGDRTTMPVGSFHYDKQQGDVMIRIASENLEKVIIEVAVLQRLLSASNVENLVLRNLSFEHSNTTATTRGGAAQLDGKNIKIENIKMRRTDGACLGLNGIGHEIISSSFHECGQMGMGGRGSGWRISDVTVSRNNTRGFNKWWEAGGAKFVGDGGLKNSTIARLRAIENRGDGIWFDWKNRDNRVTDSVFAFNAGFGIHLEIGERFTVDNNIVMGNRQRGIYLRQTSLSTIAFNLIANNGMDGIAIVDEGQRDPKGEMDFSVRNNLVVGNILAWNQIGLTMPEPLGDNRSDGNVFIGDGAASQLRLGWAKTLSRADWTGRGLDPASEWKDLQKAQRPPMDAALPIDDQLAWLQSVRSGLRPLPTGLLADLKNRSPAFDTLTDTKPGLLPASKRR